MGTLALSFDWLQSITNSITLIVLKLEVELVQQSCFWDPECLMSDRVLGPGTKTNSHSKTYNEFSGKNSYSQ